MSGQCTWVIARPVFGCFLRPERYQFCNTNQYEKFIWHIFGNTFPKSMTTGVYDHGLQISAFSYCKERLLAKKNWSKNYFCKVHRVCYFVRTKCIPRCNSYRNSYSYTLYLYTCSVLWDYRVLYTVIS